MDLRAGYPFWLIKDGLPFSYPKLETNIETDVVVVGAGISGALMRYHLLEAGIDCVTVDARTVGLGSTCASTALLQYEIDTPLSKLMEFCGEQKARRAYRLCGDAIVRLAKIARDIGLADFEMRPSLYFASYKKDVGFLKNEYQARKSAGFDVKLLNEQQIEKRFGFSAPAAIWSRLGAEVDAYAFTHRLLRHKIRKSAIFDRTKIVKTSQQPGGVELLTDEGFTIKAKKVVYATGYEVTEMIDKEIVKLLSTYAVVSEQYNDMSFWKAKVLLWNTANPYLYMRTTSDRRILVGGRDEPFYDPARRDKLIATKTRQIEKDFCKLFPDLKFKSEFSWAGTFGSTQDGLPYIGRYDKYPNSYFALGFGGNGITFSLVAAEIITDMILGKTNKDAEIFAFNRKINKISLNNTNRVT